MDQAKPPSIKDIAVFVHVHYLDVWAELSRLIAERINVPFRLIVTTSLQDAVLAKPDTIQMTSMEVIAVENRGRDILPFIRALAQNRDFDIGLKLHTKKSPQRSPVDLPLGRIDALPAVADCLLNGPIRPSQPHGDMNEINATKPR